MALGPTACVLLYAFAKANTDRSIHTQNEQEVGNAIKESGVPREDIFITSKARVSSSGFLRSMTRDITAVEPLPRPRGY